MTRPLAAAGLLAGILAILYTTGWAQQKGSDPRLNDPFGQPGDDPFGQPGDDPFGQGADDPFGPSSKRRPPGRGSSGLAPPGTFQGVAMGSYFFLLDTRNGKTYRHSDGEWREYLPPVHAVAAKSKQDEESRLQAQEKQLRDRIQAMQEQISHAQQHLKQLELERSRLLLKKKASQ